MRERERQLTRILPNITVAEDLKILSDSLAIFFAVISSEQSSPPDEFEVMYKLLKSFRGDCMHAGASYRTISRHIFASCSNKPLENENVFVAESKCN